MRSDGMPWFFDQYMTLPLEVGSRKHGNFNIDQFGHLLGQMLLMHQGRAKPLDEAHPRILQLPFFIVPLAPGMRLWNFRTGVEYEVEQVIQDYRAANYSTPKIADAPETVLIKPRKWRNGFHPDELTGATVQLKSENWDLDLQQGDFFVIESSNRIAYRQAYAEVVGPNGSTKYQIKWRVDRHEPNFDKEPFGDTRGLKALRRHSRDMETNDPTMVAELDAQFFDSLVSFELAAENALELNLLTQWFECFMDRHIPALEREGFNRVLYWDRRETEDPFLNKPDTGAKRKIRYYVRSERLWPGISPKLRQVDLEVKPKTQEE